MLKKPTIKIETEISEIIIRSGEVVTIWLDPEDGDRIQVELQVDKSGKPTIFLLDKDIQVVKSFSDYQ